MPDTKDMDNSIRESSFFRILLRIRIENTVTIQITVKFKTDRNIPYKWRGNLIAIYYYILYAVLLKKVR